jgi:hypothetical protein
MKTLLIGVALVLATGMTRASDAFFDRVEEALTFSAHDSRVRARISGTLELEGYDHQLPPPGVIDTASRRLFVPRLSVFVDAQLGSRWYAFAQVRADRGFDPRAADGEVRLDEYALRYTPWRNGRLNVQIGKFATIVGNWAARHGGWVNPFITAPLPYEHLTGIWDTEAIRNSNVLLQWSHVRPADRVGSELRDGRGGVGRRRPAAVRAGSEVGLAVVAAGGMATQPRAAQSSDARRALRLSAQSDVGRGCLGERRKLSARICRSFGRRGFWPGGLSSAGARARRGVRVAPRAGVGGSLRGAL